MYRHTKKHDVTLHTYTKYIRRGETTPSGAVSVASEGHQAPDDGLGAWDQKEKDATAAASKTTAESGESNGDTSQRESLGLGGTRKSDMKPFQWDTTVPKLADRKMLNMLVN